MTPPEKMLMRSDEYRVMFQVENEYWWYRGLRSLLKHLLPRYLPRDAHALILDAGCGTGANLQLLQTWGRVIGIDLAREALDFCRVRGVPSDRLLAASVTDLPFASDTFDLIVSFDVICNIPDDVGAFEQVAHILKPGGYFIVQLPAYQWLWSMHDVAVGHQRRYSARETRTKLEHIGLRVVRLLHTNVLLLPFAAIERWSRRYAMEQHAHVVSDLQLNLPAWLNQLLTIIYRTEMALAARLDFPVGLSVIAIAKKK